MNKDENQAKQEAALAQRAAGELPPLPKPETFINLRMFSTDQMNARYREGFAAGAARAVGGVDELEEFRKWMSNNGQSAIYIGDGLFEGIANDMYSAWRGRAELSSAPVAPVGDGDERDAELWRMFCRRLNQSATPIRAKWKLIEISPMYGDETQITDVRAALTQQKG